MQTNTKNIFNHTDYRTFLKAHIDDKRTTSPNWSLGVWAKRMEISSTAVLTNILNGKRNPGKDIQKKIVKYFKFNKREEEFFADLIRLKKTADDPRLSIAIMEKMKRHNPNGHFTLLNDETFNTISKWYYYAIREMVKLDNFIEDHDWIAEKLKYKVTATEIKNAINDLIKIELLARTESGKLVATCNTFKSTNGVASEGLKRFHEGMITNAKEAIRNAPLAERDISGRTLNIAEHNLPKLKEYIREFRDKVEELFEDSHGDARTYQLNLQLFPLMEDISGEKNENLN